MATFGKTTEGPSLQYGWWPDAKYASRHILTEHAQVTGITAYINSDEGYPTPIKVGIYADVNGAPGALLVESQERIIEATGWHEFAVSATLPPGYYWLSILFQLKLNLVYADAETNQFAYGHDAYVDGFTDPFGPPSFMDVAMSIYATYTPTSGPSMHQLSIDSQPIIEVPITVNDLIFNTPFTNSLEEGIYIIVAPATVQAANGTYNFVSWENGTTNPQREVNLMADTSLIVNYELVSPPTKHLLTIDSTPIQGVPLTIEEGN